MTIRWGGSALKVGWSVSVTVADLPAEMFDMLRGPVRVAGEPVDSRRLLISRSCPRYAERRGETRIAEWPSI